MIALNGGIINDIDFTCAIMPFTNWHFAFVVPTIRYSFI